MEVKAALGTDGGEQPGPDDTGTQRGLRPHYKEHVSRAREVRRRHPAITPSAQSPVTLGKGWHGPPGSLGQRILSQSRAGNPKAVHPRGRRGHACLHTLTPVTEGSPQPCAGPSLSTDVPRPPQPAATPSPG